MFLADFDPNFAPEFLSVPPMTMAVIGDVMLDQYVTGHIKRLAPEAPVPVLSDTSCMNSLGGPALVAKILSKCGHRVHLCGVVGNDSNAAILRDLMGEIGLNDKGIMTDPARPTTIKTRYQQKHDLLLRVDDEKTDFIAEHLETKIFNHLQSILDLSVIIISDYGKGVASPALCALIITWAKSKNIPVLIDPKGSDWTKYKGATLITPNVKELKDVYGDFDITTSLTSIARDMITKYDLSALLVTRSEDGMDYISAQDHIHADSKARFVTTVVGAGDNVMVGMAIGYALKKPIRDSIEFATNLAARHIEQGVASTPMSNDNYTPSSSPQWDEARQTISRWQSLGYKVGFTNGCFDILHAGHVMYLNQAKQHCDRLVVGLNSDQSVRLLKGPTRPINSEHDRADVMMGLKAVDHVVFFGATETGADNTPTNVIAHLKPDIFFKGGDYTIDQLPEAKAVLSYGGEVKILGLLDGRSTTNIIAKSQNT